VGPACCRRLHHAPRPGPSASSTPGSAGSPPACQAGRPSWQPCDLLGPIRWRRSRPVARCAPVDGFPRMACGESLHRNQALPTTVGRSSRQGDLSPRARVPTVGCSTSHARMRIARGVPSRGGCRRCRGGDPDTGMQDIRHVTSVLTRRRSGRAVRPGAIAPGIPGPPGRPALLLAIGPSRRLPARIRSAAARNLNETSPAQRPCDS